jgi:uncharacterized ferritin-like protein (DUF455 family)
MYEEESEEFVMDLVWRRIRPFPPLAAVTQSLRDHCYLENQLLEMLAGWTLFTPETSVKIMLGEHLYEDAQHVDGLRARLLELRARQEDHTPSDELARLCEEIWKAPDTATRLAGAYLVLKPRLAESYFALARTTEPLVDAPTVRLLNQLGQQETRQVEEATRQLERLTVTLAAREAVETLVKRLGDRLESTGGIHSRGADRGSYSFKKAFPRGIVGAREKPFWYAADSSELPGFQPFTSHRGKILAMHTLLNGEIGTVERMAKIITEFPELPWAMRFALARQAWDEARHIGIVASAVRELGGEWGLYPFNCTIWKVHVDRPDPLERLALGNAKFEGQLCSQLRDWIGICRADGSDTLGEILDFLLADELPHVRNGKQWLPVVARNDPKRQQAVLAWADTQAAQLMDKFDATSAVREH